MSTGSNNRSSEARGQSSGPGLPSAVEKVSQNVTSIDGRYVRRAFIAKGSHKVVYHCFDEEEGIEVAWNEIDTTSIYDLSKVQREIALLQSLNHPNIIQCHASWHDEERRALVFITELMTSGTLSDFISQQTSNSLKTHVMVKYCRQILTGLAYLASQDVIHRDLKSNNIFINGHKGEVKIGDLGLSIASRAANSVLGTPEYMAPEIYEENYTNAVDMWSFGMCMLQMVSGMHPYQECENVGQIFRKVTNGILPESAEAVTDPRVKDVIFKCLLLDPAKRPTAEELMNDTLFKILVEVEEHDVMTTSSGGSEAAVEKQQSTTSLTGQDLRETATPSKDTTSSDQHQQLTRKGSTSLPRRRSDDDLFQPQLSNGVCANSVSAVLEWVKAGPRKCQQATAQLALDNGWIDLRSHAEWKEWFEKEHSFPQPPLLSPPPAAPSILVPSQNVSGAAVSKTSPKLPPMTQARGESPDISIPPPIPSPSNTSQSDSTDRETSKPAGNKTLSDQGSVEDLFNLGQQSQQPQNTRIAGSGMPRPLSSASIGSSGSGTTDKKAAAAATEQRLLAQMFSSSSTSSTPKDVAPAAGGGGGSQALSSPTPVVRSNGSAALEEGLFNAQPPAQKAEHVDPACVQSSE